MGNPTNPPLDALEKLTAVYVALQRELDVALVEKSVYAQKVIDVQTVITDLQSRAAAAKTAMKGAATGV